MNGSPLQPIGVFDSGVGGLTVLRALCDLMPEESTLYLGDTARIPYGTRSPDVVVRYSVQNARFLEGRGIKLLVVACNTASAVALPALSQALSIPVVGVIAPGARWAAARTRSGRVGVLGTAATVASGAYERALKALRPDVEVWSQACPLFVPLAEEGWVSGEVPTRVAEFYLQGVRAADVDTLVLGCTHYPLLKDVIAAQVGPGVVLVDSAHATADAVRGLLERTGGRVKGTAQPE
ncbi:MAG TPA: glutamate racemase, partial [Myxococcaceae bacterium]|nr:glutamate racemase [Myxococcaceae bacterium]